MLRALAITLAVAAGSALGAVARHLVSHATVALLGPGFGWGTLVVNVAGAFLIGLFAAATGAGGRVRAGAVLANFVVAGFCGGFTTFSIFSLEVLEMGLAGAPGRAGLYVAVSLVLWLGAVWAGHRAGSALGRR